VTTDSYFRPKQTDINGSSSFSKIVATTITDQSLARVYPNSASTVINIATNHPDHTSVSLMIATVKKYK